jgi:hypothetical protein
MERCYRSEYLPFYALASVVEPELETDQKRPELKGVRNDAIEMSDKESKGERIEMKDVLSISKEGTVRVGKTRFPTATCDDFRLVQISRRRGYGLLFRFTILPLFTVLIRER